MELLTDNIIISIPFLMVAIVIILMVVDDMSWKGGVVPLLIAVPFFGIDYFCWWGVVTLYGAMGNFWQGFWWWSFLVFEILIALTLLAMCSDDTH